MEITTQEKIRQSVLLMLGFPVISINLDQEQIDLSIASAEKYVKDQHFLGHKNLSDDEQNDLIQEGALYKSQMILGRMEIADNQWDILSKSKTYIAGCRGHARWERKIHKYLFVDNDLFTNILLSLLNNPKVNPEKAVALTWSILRQMDHNIKGSTCSKKLG